jgi:hypothetical protein
LIFHRKFKSGETPEQARFLPALKDGVSTLNDDEGDVSTAMGLSLA